MGPVSVRLAWAPAGAREQREHRRREHLGAHTRGQRTLRGTVPTLQVVSELFWWEGMAPESERLAILSPRSSFRFWLSFQRRAEVSMCALGRCLCVRGRGEGRARRKARGPVSAITHCWDPPAVTPTSCGARSASTPFARAAVANRIPGPRGAASCSTCVKSALLVLF